MSRRFVVEVDDKIYEELQKSYQDAKNINKDLNFEEFVAEILIQFANVKNQAGNLFGKFSKAMLDNFDPSQLEEMLSSLKNMGDFFSSNSETKSETEVEKDKKNDQSEIDHNSSNKKS